MLVKNIMSKEIHYIKVPGNRDQALTVMREKGYSGVPVVKGDTKKLVGILTRSDLVDNPDEEQIALMMTRDPITTKPEDDISDVARKLVENQIRRIPVVENDELVGIITAFDLVADAIAELDMDMPVKDIMLKGIPTTWDKTPLKTAFEIMRFFNLKVVLAVDNDGQLSGVLTETDFLNESEIVSEQTVHNTSVGTEGDKWSWDSSNVLYVIKNQLKFSDKEVKDVATANPVTVTPKTSVSECAKKMKELHIEQLPVMDIEGELIGLARASDLIKALLD